MTKGFRAAAWALTAGWPPPANGDSVPAGKPETVGFSTERLQRVHTAMQAQIDAGNIAGVMMLVESGETITVGNLLKHSSGLLSGGLGSRGQAAVARTAFESAVRQAIVN